MYNDELIVYQNQRLWWIIAGLGLLILVLTATVWHQAHLPLPTPWIYVPTIHGEIIGRVQPVQGVQDIPDAVIQRILDDYLEKAFSISTVYDENVQHQQAVADMTAGPATAAMMAWWKENDPITLGQKYTQSVKIKSRLKERGQGIYEYHWQLIRRSLTDDTPVVSDWRGELQAVHLAATETNNLGVFVTSIQWTQEQE
jgi:type IV secretory pathway TrbF-like protein